MQLGDSLNVVLASWRGVYLVVGCFEDLQHVALSIFQPYRDLEAGFPWDITNL